jgi:hypothetical protein
MFKMDDNDSLVVDTGSAFHNVFDQTIIHDFKPLEPGLRGILMPNGMIEPILGTRRVHLDVTNPFGGKDTIVLLDVHWAQGLKFNLLSENTAMKKGGRFEDSPYGGKLLYKLGEKIHAVKRELDKGVHSLKCKPQPVLESNPISLGLLGTKVSDLTKEQYDATRLHRALGHPGRTTFINTLKEEHVTGTIVIAYAVKQLGSCESCLTGKQTRNPFQEFGRCQNWKLGELLVFDIFVAPREVVSQPGFKYQLTAVDFNSRYCLVTFFTHNHEAAHCIKRIHPNVERQTGGRSKSFKIDRGGKFLNNTLLDYCDQLGIQLELRTPYTSHQNGLAERMHLTIFDKVRAMVLTLPKSSIEGKKLGPMSEKGTLMGYSMSSKAWRGFMPNGVMRESRTGIPS